MNYWKLLYTVDTVTSLLVIRMFFKTFCSAKITP